MQFPVVDTQQMHLAVEASRVGRVGQVFSLMEEHRHALTEFVNEDPRGRHLFTYLPRLAAELVQEQESLRQNLKKFGYIG